VGHQTVGELASLPGTSGHAAPGATGAHLHRLANGLDAEPFPAPAACGRHRGRHRGGLHNRSLEPLSFLLRGLLDRVLQRLACRSLACAGLTLRLTLAPRGFDVREIALPSPTREASILLQLVRLDLERRPPDTAWWA